MENSAHNAILRLMQQLKKMPDHISHNYLTTFNPKSSKEELHHIRLRPQCPSCGKSNMYSENVIKPVELKNEKRIYSLNGGYRSLSPEETLKNLEHLINPLTGIVCNINPVQSKNHSLRPVYSASYFIHPHVFNAGPDEQFVTKSFGKGHTALQAKASALCEAIERYNTLIQGDEPIVRGTYKSFKNDAVDPGTLLNFSDLQYSQRKKTLLNTNAKYLVPLPFDYAEEIDWTYAWSLTYNKKRVLPASFCYSYYPAPENENMCPFTSNGNAAGNTLEEAILQGYLELIERDCVAVWWYNRTCHPKIDINSFNDPYFSAVYNHYRELGWEHWVLDITHDIGIPVAVSVAFNKKIDGYIIGMGCHLDLHIAVQRAITEMHQVFDPEKHGLWRETEFDCTSFLHPVSNKISNAYSYPNPHLDSIDDDVKYCMKKTEMLGLETIVLDYTRPDINLKTVKVIVPGLRHFWRRLGPGRLYDVPVKMNWINRKLEEHELNPISLQL